MALDIATGKRSILVSSEKLEAALPKEEGKSSQATGLDGALRAQYQWAPSGEALLMQSSSSLVWFDLKSQTPRTLVNGKAELADAKISPDGKFVSFVRGHNLWLVGTADGKERAVYKRRNGRSPQRRTGLGLPRRTCYRHGLLVVSRFFLDRVS